MAVSLICWALWPYGRQSDNYVGLCGRMAVSLICWTLWPYGHQSDNYVGLCGRMAVSLICWALWPYGRQSDNYVGLCGRTAVGLICWACGRTAVSLICHSMHSFTCCILQVCAELYSMGWPSPTQKKANTKDIKFGGSWYLVTLQHERYGSASF